MTGLDTYVWIKALHIIAVIAWMAGLLYLPRLFVYHCRAADVAQADTFAIMEERLLRIIMRPAMIATWGLGIVLAAMPGIVAWSSDVWIYVKLAGVVVLTIVHMVLARHARDFAAGRNVRSERYFRLLNEVPTAAMIVIVIMVVVKPF